MSLRGTEITLRRISAPKNFSLHNFLDNEISLKKLSESLQSKIYPYCRKHRSWKIFSTHSSYESDPTHERVVILEDSPELPIPNELSSKLLARSDRFGFREGAEWDLCHLVLSAFACAQIG